MEVNISQKREWCMLEVNLDLTLPFTLYLPRSSFDGGGDAQMLSETEPVDALGLSLRCVQGEVHEKDAGG
jgi:hypothetical protein